MKMLTTMMTWMTHVKREFMKMPMQELAELAVMIFMN